MDTPENLFDALSYKSQKLWAEIKEREMFAYWYSGSRNAYEALKEYDAEAERLESLGRKTEIKPSLMQYYADKYGTTPEEMKKQWRTLEEIKSLTIS